MDKKVQKVWVWTGRKKINIEKFADDGGYKEVELIGKAGAYDGENSQYLVRSSDGRIDSYGESSVFFPWIN